MPPTETRRRRSLLGAMALLGAASLLVEWAAFRLNAAVHGSGYARLLAALAPAVGGAVAAWWGARRATVRDADGAIASAAHAAGLAAAMSGLAAVALNWSSQRIAKNDGSLLPLVVTALAWCALAGGLSASVAWGLRATQERGRALFVLASGAAFGAILAPGALALAGPRVLLGVGFLLAGASGWIARATTAKVRAPVMVTIPLALLALLLGDVRNPWLRVRTDVGRKGRVGVSAWTADGLVQVDVPKSGVVPYTIDRSAPRPLALQENPSRRQSFELADMAYFACDTSGPALIVGSGGGREIREALDAGHPAVDAIEPSSAVVRVMATSLAHDAGDFLAATDRVTLRFGDPRGALSRLRPRYDRIVVIGDRGGDPVSSRALVDASRAHTVEAMRAYLARLAEPKGVLLIRSARTELPGTIATLAAAVGVDSVDDRAVACAERKEDGVAGLLVLGAPAEATELQAIAKSCKRRGLTVEFPLAESRQGDRDHDAKEVDRQERSAALASGVVATDDRPFLESAPARAQWRTAVRDSVRALRPIVPSRSSAKGEASEALPRASGVGIGGVAAMLAFLALAVAWLAPVRTDDRAVARDGRRFPGSLRLAVLAFGWVAGLVTPALDDATAAVLGGGDAAWSVAVPFVLVSLGLGWWLGDTFAARIPARAWWWVGGAALIACFLMGFVSPGAYAMATWPLAVRVAMAFVSSLFIGAAAAAPTGALVQRAARFAPECVRWSWGVLVAATAAGAACAQLIARFGGVSRVGWVAFGAVVLGLLLVAFSDAGDRRASEGRTA